MKKSSVMIILNDEYEFKVLSYLQNRHTVVFVSVKERMVNQFMKVENNSEILKSVANLALGCLGGTYGLKLNPYDSGTEWLGVYGVANLKE